jgi:negative regulator of sigma E activity
MDEQRLEQLAGEIGRERAAGVDPEATAQAVLRRLRTEPAAQPWWRRAGQWPRRRVVQVAAAAVILLVAAFGVRELVGPGGSGTYAGPAELQELASTELTEVLDSLEFEAPVYELVEVSLYDLSESELSALLEELEG